MVLLTLFLIFSRIFVKGIMAGKRKRKFILLSMYKNYPSYEKDFDNDNTKSNTPKKILIEY